MRHVRKRPTGAAATLASAVVIVASKAGVRLTVAEATTIIGALSIAVSYFTPRM